MKFLTVSIISISLSSCASTESLTRLSEAEKNVEAFNLAKTFLDVDLITSTNLSSSEAKIKKDNAIIQANIACKEPYEKEMQRKILESEPTQDINTILSLPSYAVELDQVMTKCLADFDLKGKLAAKYKSNIYSIPDVLTILIQSTKEYADATIAVEEEKKENAAIISSLALAVGAAAVAASGDYGAYSSPPRINNSYGINSSLSTKKSPITYNSIGDTTYSSDGTSCSKLGNGVYCSDGTSYSSIGNTVYSSDGTSCTKLGSGEYCSDGTSYSILGNSIYGSDGTSCNRIGSSMYCN